LEEEVRSQVQEQVEKEVEMRQEELEPKQITEGASSFTASNATQVVLVQQQGSGKGLVARSPGSGGLVGKSTKATGSVFGVKGVAASTKGRGVLGEATAASGATTGVWGQTKSPGGRGVFGLANATSGFNRGVMGQTKSTQGIGVLGLAVATTGKTNGVRGVVKSAQGTAGVFINKAGGKILSGRTTGNVEVFSVDGSGNFTLNGSSGGLIVQANATSPNLVGGFSGNSVTSGVVGASIGGGGDNTATNRVTDDWGTVGGGINNQAGDNAGSPASMRFATVGGGVDNTASSTSTTVGGGAANTATAPSATVAGGMNNTASGSFATVGGGLLNTASSTSATVGGGAANTATAPSATVAGGMNNTASGSFATVGGGLLNTASNLWATVSGGWFNTASGSFATVGGGNSNTASGSRATVGGGNNNTASNTNATVGGGNSNTASGIEATVGGGNSNTASGIEATVGGGAGNTASGDWATVPGGWLNVAQGIYSFAAGRRAKANHDGAFVWGDTTDADVASTAPNQFTIRASGGVTFFSSTDTTSPAPGVNLPAGASAWTTISDRASKENFAPVDGQALLARLNAIPLLTWNWRAQDASIRHMGPMAQDFRAAFGLGSDDKHISTVDADGVALAAIQELYRMSLQKDERIRELMRELKELRALVAQVSAEQQFEKKAARCDLPVICESACTGRFRRAGPFRPSLPNLQGWRGGKVLETFDPAPLDSARGEQGKPLREGTGVIEVLVTLQ
jgi:hypothetical protein